MIALRPRHVLSDLPPNWFASVMGTGIVATAAASLPVAVPGLLPFATVVWALAAALLVALVVATVAHWAVAGRAALRHLVDPVVSHFWGAPAMALLTVGAGTLLVGRTVIGEPAAVAVDWVLWSLGTALGLVTVVALPYRTFVRADVTADSPFGGWLMPIVPPMVSASTGALLVPYAPAGQPRETLLWGCYAMFGLALVPSLLVIAQLWARLSQRSIGGARLVPTLWIVLGPVGQSVTAANLLGGVAHGVVAAPIADGLQVFGLVYGVPMIGFGLLWAALAALVTLRTARDGLPFSLTWWSFTFPVGTCVTGLNGLALHTGLGLFAVLACVAYAGLVVAWAVVSVRTFRASVVTAAVFAPPIAVHH
ncbi:TDT family transporter [Frondihabitans australicus]|uniref:Tellurite resistance protein TehA-like permease n=1 Tax=Frondihabitans australicus TaxID=386892 RepID=A0A495IG81_9MICO|nr:TDT family transporter [Frondihabitans australicus]RKR74944.1 tellurite resistance protein TehA-like permease [Frondihabitans australicus]